MRLFFAWVILVCGAFELTAQSYFLNGDATFLGNDCYQVTANNDWQNGTVWYSDQLNLNEDFSIEFDMYFGTTDANGADGMAFVLQTVGPSAIGASGGGMGFQGFDPSFGIEFDTYVNPDANDPNYDHVAFLRNGNIFHNSADNLAGPVAATSGQTNIEDGQSHQVKITWDASAQIVALYVDCNLRLTDNINLINSIFQGNSMVYWGFTGATGGLFNEQRVCLDIIVNNAPNSYSVCEGAQVELAANGSLAGTVLWSPIDNLDDPTSFHPVATPSQSTEYCYTYTDFCGESTTTCVQVEVVSLPVIEVQSQWTFCEDEMYLLEAVISDYTSIQWSAINGALNGPSNQLAVEVAEAGEYTVTAGSGLVGCESTSTVSVEVLPVPQFEPTPMNICPDEETTLAVPVDFDIVAWWDGSNDHSVVVDAPGTYSVDIALDGCSNQIEFVVDLWPVPVLDLGPDLSFCFDDEPLVLDAGVLVTWNEQTQSESLEVSTSGQYIAEWNDGNCILQDDVMVDVTVMPTVIISGPEGFCEDDEVTLTSNYSGLWSNDVVGTEITADAEGLFSIDVTDGPCSAVQSFQLIAWDSPDLELGPNITLFDDQELVLTAGDDFMGLVYDWSNGESTSSIEVDSSGWYVCHKSNDCGQAEDSLYVQFMDCQSALFIPNTFTPNADGINDEWWVTGLNVSEVKIQVFDRWGLLVFETVGTEQPWLGDYLNGTHFVPSDSYHYVVRFVNIQGDHLKQTGTVSVIR